MFGNRFVYRVVVGALAMFYRLWLRIEVIDAHHVPLSGAALLAPNHRSLLDPPAVAMSTPRQSRFLAKQWLFRFRPVRALLHSLGAVAVSASASDRRALSLCVEMLKQGDLVTVFPEGGIRSTATVQPLHAGAAFIALRAGCAVVPVGIAGTEEALPAKARFIRRGRVVVAFGPPIGIEPYAALPLRKGSEGLTVELTLRLQDVMNRARDHRAGRQLR